MTLQSAEDLLKPKDPSPNPILAGSLYDQSERKIAEEKFEEIKFVLELE
jgi:hypothetical protein